jgi:replicative DNA helicase
MSDTLSNPRAEIALLGTAFRASGEQLTQMATTVREEWFTAVERVIAWRTMSEFIGRGLPVSVPLVQDALRAHGAPDVETVRLVEDLARAVPTAEVWQELAKRVEKYFIRRRGRDACMEHARKFEDLSMDPMAALESAESDLFSLHSANMGHGMRHISASLGEALANIQESMNNKGHVTGGLATGFTDLDRMNIKGMRPGQVYIFSAPPGGGKTVFLMKLLWNVAIGRGDYHEYKHAAARAGLFSLEMSDVALAERVLIRLAEIEMAKMDSGLMSRAEQERIRKACEEIKASLMFIEYTPGATIQQLRVKARYGVMRHKLQIIGIDYAQLIGSSSKDARGNRTQALVDVSIGLTEIAKECQVPLVVLAQPKQDTWGTRAGLNALSETSQLAKDADMVGQLGFWSNLKFREGEDPTAGEKKQGAEFGKEADDPLVIAYLDIVKNRNGPNTENKPPIRLDWERDFFDMASTTDRLLSNNAEHHQKR